MCVGEYDLVTIIHIVWTIGLPLLVYATRAIGFQNFSLNAFGIVIV